jgi:uracil phosphoribosyltransferase
MVWSRQSSRNKWRRCFERASKKPRFFPRAVSFEYDVSETGKTRWLVPTSGVGFMAFVFPSRHPVLQHKLASLRHELTPAPEFRRLVRSLALQLAHEATADLPTKPVEIPTPLATASCRALADTVAIVPILRAGLGMADGVLDLIPEAEVWHIGLFRDEQTLRPTQYYNKLPSRSRASLALLVDPMLATGGSAVHACEILREAGIPRIKLLALIAAPEGIARLSEAMPDVAIHVGAIDERLTDIGFIYPGLGDAGDRQFKTGGE